MLYDFCRRELATVALDVKIVILDYLQFAYLDLRQNRQTLHVFLPSNDDDDVINENDVGQNDTDRLDADRRYVVKLWNGSEIDFVKGFCTRSCS